jgi:DNA polymerase-1
MESKYKATVSQGEEADDLIAMEAAKLNYKACVASIDKDMLQIPCWHFNIVRGDYLEVTPFGGIKFFYTQILTGDRADNIVGLFRVGPVKAKKILEDAETEEDLWDCVVKAYDGNEDRVLENARLLWLRREEAEIWQPPKVRSDNKL